MSQSQVHLLASSAIAACWGAFALAWLGGALYNASRGPAKHTGAPFGSGMLIGAVIVWVIFRIVPAADWQSVTVQAVWARLPGLAILLGATAFTRTPCGAASIAAHRVSAITPAFAAA